eukprot:Phypoly_transcript_13692.p1 GENE.Phypoly_transcript_13692~~Phypoly_transcript_13692.p1  ORF type:complete len:233 (+),score=35.13 Phypoly_transcript_13692:117-815(+)
MPSTGVKFFSSILAYGLVPLLIAAQSNKVSYLVVLDLSVWLVAVAALVYLVKTPWELWVLAKAKAKDLEEMKKSGGNVQAEMADLRQIEHRMYYIAMATPFLSTGGWHFLSQFVAKYGFNAMTEIVHPYFILMVGIMAGLYPVHKYYSKMKVDLKVSQPLITSEVHQMYTFMKQKQDILEKLQKQIEAEVLKNESNRVKIEREVKALRKEMLVASHNKSEGIHSHTSLSPCE